MQSVILMKSNQYRFLVALAVVALVFVSSACQADGGIGAAVGAMRALLVTALVALGLVPILALAAAICFRRPKKTVFRLLLVLLAGAYVFVAVALFYAWDTDILLLTLFIEAWGVAGLLIFLMVEHRAWRMLLMTGLVVITFSSNLPYPRLIDFYARNHVDNRDEFRLIEFERDAYWRALVLEDGRQILITTYPPASMRDPNPVIRDASKKQRDIKSPIILAPKAGTTAPASWEIQVLERTPESYLTSRRVYFTVPILGEINVKAFTARTVGEATLLANGIEHVDQYLYEFMTLPSRTRARPTQDYWAEQLLKLDIDPNYADPREGSSLLMAAIRNDRYAAARSLIDRGADVNQGDNRGRTPLHAAAFANSKYVALLLQHGADPLAVDKNGNTPVDAVKRGPLGGKTRNAKGEFVPPVESPRYLDGLKSLELLESRIRDSGTVYLFQNRQQPNTSPHHPSAPLILLSAVLTR